MTKPIKLFAHARGPNSWKPAIIMDELNVPYEMEFLGFENLHTPEFEQHNPNGRVPTIIDPNTGITLWESGAIIQYLIETYDKEKKLTYTTFPEKHKVDQYLFWQVSGQGPYFGQAVWFIYFHPEKVESVQERYLNEMKRLTKVLDGLLSGREWLVGDKYTYADLSFVPWYWFLPGIEPVIPGFGASLKKENPNFAAWIERLDALPSVKKASKARDEKVAAEEAGK